MRIEFRKYQGTGNDFVILDNRNGLYTQLDQAQIAHICNRRYGVGADGLMMLELKDGFDFQMKYYNADGKEGSMCGNGGRCIVKFAKDLNLIHDKTFFIAVDGPHDALFNAAGFIELKMKDVDGIEKRGNISILNTGSPHYIEPVSMLNELDVESNGKAIRYNDEFKETGININFISLLKDGLHIRTYERGVEAETLSCGTGATAAALSVADDHIAAQVIPVITKGGPLEIKFKKNDDGSFVNIWLCGPAEYVFNGTISL